MNPAPDDLSRAKALCAEFSKRNDPVGWFDALYREANGREEQIPWAGMAPNPHLLDWRRITGYDFRGKRCLKIGCGLGDDAEYMAQAGGVVTAFDISPTAIQWCRRRFPDSKVDYREADLFAPPGEWTGAFDFVLEIFTIQALPPELRERAIGAVCQFPRPGGELLLISMAREPHEPPPAPPWPMLRQELEHFSAHGMTAVSIEDYLDSEDPPSRRFRVLFRREREREREA